ncbi:MAG: tandem-95 repeat protein [Planctomycetales bacterium]|nr:tandem-95 repeat protein [Planctomycetales bacterium]
MFCTPLFIAIRKTLVRSWTDGRRSRRRLEQHALLPIARQVERLEDRTLLSVTTNFAAGALTISSDGADAMSVASNGSNEVTINGSTIDPGGGNLLASAVTSLSVTGGPGGNNIDTSGVTIAVFTALTSVTLDGAGGNDTITGSEFGETLIGGSGNDVLIGGAGNDTYQFAAGYGTDTITEAAASGNDTMTFTSVTATLNAGTFVVDAGSGNVATPSGNIETVVNSSGTFNVTTSATNAGTISINAGTLNVTNSTITGGTVSLVGASNLNLSNGAVVDGTVTNSTTGTIRSVASNIVANTLGGTVSNPAGGQILVNNTTTLVLNGGAGNSYANAGNIGLNATANGATLRINGDVSLTGGGTVTLSNNTGNFITGTVSTNRLTNVDNTISGAGFIGFDTMAFTNQSVVEANVSNILDIDPSGSGAINSGTLRASNGGTLRFTNGTIDNTGGLVRVDSSVAASTLNVSNSTVTSGTVELIGASALNLTNGAVVGGTLTNSTSGIISSASATTNTLGGSVTNPAGGQINVLNISTLVLTGGAGNSYSNTGTINLNSVNGTTLRINGDVALTGGGSVVLSNFSLNVITGTAATDRLTNEDNTISGAGRLGANSMAFTNRGLVRANQSNALVVDTTDGAANFVNSGTLESINGASLGLLGANLTNFEGATNGTLRADGTDTTAANFSSIELVSSSVVGGVYEAQSFGELSLSNGQLTGGTLTNSASGMINIQSATSNNVIGGTVSNPSGGQINVLNITTLVLMGGAGNSYSNAGTINLSSANGTTLRIDGDVTLTGGGSVVLSNFPLNTITGTVATNRLTNEDNTISGAGNIGNNGMSITNRGTIRATQTATLTIDPGAGGFTNEGTVDVDPTRTLAIGGGDVLEQTSGNTIVDGTLTGNVTLTGGTLSGSGIISGTLTNTSGTVSPGNSPETINVTTFSQGASGHLAIEIGGTTAGTEFDQLLVSGAATLNGFLDVTIINGFVATLGQSFQVMTYVSRTGTFSNLTGTCIPGNLALSPTYSATALTLDIVQAADAIDDSPAAFDEDSPLTFDPRTGDLGAGNTITAVTQGAKGGVTFTGTSVTYTPNADTNGADSFTYTITDASGCSDTATINVAITPVNDVPRFTLGGNPPSINEEAGAQSIDNFATGIAAGPATATDETSQTLTFNVNVQGTTGGLTFNSAPAIDPATGRLTYTPAANSNGTATINVTLGDNGSGVAPNVNTSAAQTFLITVNAVNDEPSFTKGADDTVLEDSGARAVSNWATSLSQGPANELSQVLDFIVSNDNNSLFAVQPTVAANGTLTYTPAANAFGSATVTVQIHDNGGIDNGGDDTSAAQTFLITVTPVNDIPSVTSGPNQTVLEDAGAQSVSSWATNLSFGPANEVGQTLSFLVTNDNNGLFSAQPTVSPTGTLTYTPAANANGSASISLQIVDSGGTENAGVDRSAVTTITISVTPVNDVPSFTKGPDQTVLEDAGSQTVAGWATSLSQGPANESSQILNFLVSNDNAGLFSTPPAIAANGTLTYTPAANAFGSTTVTVQIHDNGGIDNSGVDTSAAQTFTITIQPVGDVPVVTNSTPGQDPATLVIQRNAGDGAEVTHFKISNITGGQLFLSDGTTTVPDGSFITVAQGTAGLRFASAAGAGTHSLRVQSATSGNDGGLPTGAGEVTTTIQSPGDIVQTRFLRMYNRFRNAHFFTTSLPEYNALKTRGYEDEASGRFGFNVMANAASGTLPIHRLYNPSPNGGGQHYFTFSDGERDFLVAAGWRFEKEEGFIFPTQQPGTVEIFHMYNSASGGHLFTENTGTRDSVLGIPGWQPQTRLGFAFAAGLFSSGGSATARTSLSHSIVAADVLDNRRLAPRDEHISRNEMSPVASASRLLDSPSGDAPTSLLAGRLTDSSSQLSRLVSANPPRESRTAVLSRVAYAAASPAERPHPAEDSVWTQVAQQLQSGTELLPPWE